MTFAEMIKAFRESSDMSMEDFARLSGLTKAYISRIERGTDPRTGNPVNPSMETIENCAKAMGIRPSELVRTIEGEAAPVTFPYKKELEQEAAAMDEAQLKRLLAYARFLQKEAADD